MFVVNMGWFSVVNGSQSRRLKSLGARADHKRIVFTVLFMYPGIGVSYGMARTTYTINMHYKPSQGTVIL